MRNEMRKSNKQIEDTAVEAVLAYELRHGRRAKDVRQDSEAEGYDVLSEGRSIEVKGTQGNRVRQQLCISSEAERNHLQSGGWLYRVTGVGSRHPEVHEIAGHTLRFVPEKRWRVTRKKK